MLARNTILQNRYRIIRPLGKGGMGHVYEAIDDTVDSIVAIKETFANTDALRSAFEREAKLVANLKHPVLPHVMHHFREGSGQFLVMEFVEGLNLAELLKLRGIPFSYNVVLPWTDKLLSALQYLHGRSEPIIHRDIKPANIKVTNDDEVFLLDFGLAKGAPGEETSSVQGYTAAFAPLEQLNNAGTNAQSDLYALGATLYQLLTGHLAVSASERYKLIEDSGSDPLIPVHRSNPEIPETLSAIISQAMSMKRKDRFASAAKMREVLREAALTIEREREQKILDTPTRLIENVHASPRPTEPAADLGHQRHGRPSSPVKDLPHGDAYLKTIPAKPPVVPPPIDLQPSWPSGIDSEPHAMDEANRRKEEERLNREAEASNRIRADEERQLREEQERQKRKEEERQRRQTVEEAARQAAEAEQQILDDERKRAENDASKLGPEEEAAREKEKARARATTKRAVLIGAAVAVIVGGYFLFSLLSQNTIQDASGGTQPPPNQQAKGAGSVPVAPAGMVYVPGGTFMMGRDDGDEYERPAHAVTVEPFFMDLYEVTCEEYAKFVKATGRGVPPGWHDGNYPAGSARKPVTGVTWNDASAYAKWAGKRLPTEEEWEFAARGTDGRLYPWGSLWHEGFANANGASKELANVGAHGGASLFGAIDMAGNAWEWTASKLIAYPGGKLPEQPPDNVRVIRGGSYDEDASEATATYRGFLKVSGDKYDKTGFRCVSDTVRSR